MATLELFFFGHPRILRDGQPVALPRRKLLALLAYLGVTGKPQPRTTLAALFWPESSQGLASLRRHLSELKQALGAEWLSIDRQTVGLSYHAGLWIDIQAFYQNLTDLPIPSEPANITSLADSQPVLEVALPLLAAAADLQPADFMEGFTLRDSQEFDDWQRDQAEFLRQRLGQTLQQLVIGLAHTGDLAAAIPYAQRWTSVDPLQESAHLVLMQLFAATGQPTASLQQYERCAAVLDEALNVEPSPMLAALRDELIRARTAPAGTTSGPGSLPRPHNLPASPTPFIGREQALFDLAHLLNSPETRLVTIRGPGGSGKTRLGLRAARDQLNSQDTKFPQGVFFVALSTINDSDLIPNQIALALHLPPQEGRPPGELTLDYLRDKALLLVLDNFEHLLAGAPFLAEILEAAPAVKILVTSRGRLDLRSETVFTLAGLPVPDWDLPEGDTSLERADTFNDASESAAVQLFINTARRGQPDFDLSPADLVDVARLCRLVDGMPLAIELAAGWVPHLPLETIAEEIGRHYSILETELRDVAPRHRSLQAVFDASWSMLSDPDKATLTQLAVFESSFDRSAAAAVGGASLRQLAKFTNTSQVLATGDGRYQFHNLQRQYALDRLAEKPAQDQAARRRHSAHFANQLIQLGADLRSARQPQAFQTLDLLFPDIQAAWRWSAGEHNYPEIEALTDCLWYFFHIRARFSDAHALFSAAAGLLPTDLPSAGRRAACKVLIYQAYFATVMGDWETGLGASAAADDLLRSEDLMRDIGVASAFLGLTRMALNDLVFGQKIGKESLATAREAGDPWALATTLNILGGAHTLLGADKEAEAFLRESATWYRQTGDRWGLAHCIFYLGTVANERGALDQAAGYFEESLKISRGLGDPVKSMQSLLMLGQLYLSAEGPAEAQEAYQEGLDLARQLGDRSAQANALTGLFTLAAEGKDFILARQLLLEALSVNPQNDMALATGAMVAFAVHEQQRNPRLAWQLGQFVLETGTAAPEVLETAERLQEQLKSRHPASALAVQAVNATRAALIHALKDSK